MILAQISYKFQIIIHFVNHNCHQFQQTKTRLQHWKVPMMLHPKYQKKIIDSYWESMEMV
jgi:hypothetical protein